MNQNDLIAYAEATFKECVDLLTKKNQDYTSEVNDVFKNLSYCEMLGLCTVEEGIATRMSDKMSRLSTILQGKELKVKDEKVEDTCKDLINYSLLLLAYISSKNNPS